MAEPRYDAIPNQLRRQQERIREICRQMRSVVAYERMKRALDQGENNAP